MEIHMTGNKWTSILANPACKFDPLKCRDEGISLLEAKFLRWVYIEGSRTNAQVVNVFGIGVAYNALKSGYVANPQAEIENTSTTLWSVTPKAVNLLKRLIESSSAVKTSEHRSMTRQQFEIKIRKLTGNRRVIGALLKCFDIKNFTKHGKLGLFPDDHRQFDTVVDWITKEGWLK